MAPELGQICQSQAQKLNRNVELVGVINALSLLFCCVAAGFSASERAARLQLCSTSESSSITAWLCSLCKAGAGLPVASLRHH